MTINRRAAERLLSATTAAAITLALLSSSTFAQEVGSPNPKDVKAGSYQVETHHTEILFTMSRFGFSNYSGFFSGVTGSLELDPANVTAAKIDVVIPIKTLETTQPPLDQTLLSNAWFDEAKYPTAEFVSTGVTQTGPNTANITGNLTLHGVTKPVTLATTLKGSGTNPLQKVFMVGFDATTEITRSDFGIDQYVQFFGDSIALRIAGLFVLSK